MRLAARVCLYVGPVSVITRNLRSRLSSIDTKEFSTAEDSLHAGYHGYDTDSHILRFPEWLLSEYWVSRWCVHWDVVVSGLEYDLRRVHVVVLNGNEHALSAQLIIHHALSFQFERNFTVPLDFSATASSGRVLWANAMCPLAWMLVQCTCHNISVSGAVSQCKCIVAFSRDSPHSTYHSPRWWLVW